MSTTEGKTLQSVIQAAIEAEDKGVAINWKAICLETYQVAMAEINRLSPSEPEEPANPDG